MCLSLEGKYEEVSDATKCLQQLIPQLWADPWDVLLCGKWSISVDGKGCKHFSEQKRWESCCGQIKATSPALKSKTRPAGFLTAEREVWDWNCCGTARCAKTRDELAAWCSALTLERHCVLGDLDWISQTVGLEQQTLQDRNIISKGKWRTKCKVFARDRWLS